MTPTEQHRIWRADVADLVAMIEHRFPNVECITYRDHPWPGWDGQSFDVWRRASTWTPASLRELRRIRTVLMALPGRPLIRHTILRHQLWTSFGGRSAWLPDDHSGKLRHLHVTYW